MLIKILNSALILFAIYMGVKQGWAMLSNKQEMLDMFGKWNFNNAAIKLMGAITIIGALMVLFPKTFVWGNFMMAVTILLIICLHLADKDLKGAAIELPFFLLNLRLFFCNIRWLRFKKAQTHNRMRDKNLFCS